MRVLNIPIVYGGLPHILNVIVFIGVCLVAVICCYKYLTEGGKESIYKGADLKLEMLADVVTPVVLVLMVMRFFKFLPLYDVCYIIMICLEIIAVMSVIPSILLYLGRYNYKYLFKDVDENEYRNTMLMISKDRQIGMVGLFAFIIFNRFYLDNMYVLSNFVFYGLSICVLVSTAVFKYYYGRNHNVLKKFYKREIKSETVKEGSK